ncbi:MAG: peptidase M4 [Gammaproteobacteria bacterium]|nr:peptidase M4 [Gammaproteobacteria bacterium]
MYIPKRAQQRRRCGRLAAAGCAALLAASATAIADHDEARALLEAGQIRPLESIIEHARSRHPGHLIEAELERKGGRYVYEIELLDEDGHVIEFYYDAQTGEPLDTGRKW